MHSIWAARSAMRGFGMCRQCKTEAGYMIFFSTKHYTYVELFRKKVLVRCPSTTFQERKLD